MMADQAIEKADGQALPLRAADPPSPEGAGSGDNHLLAIIERAARDPAVDVDKFERLIAIRRELEAERARLAFVEAFAELGPDLPSIDRKGHIVVYSKAARERPGGPTQEDSPIQKTPYAKFEDILEALRTPLHKHGFSIRFEFETTTEGKLQTTCILQHRAGHVVRATTPALQHDTTGSKNNTQAVGSALSYGMRYALRAAVPIVSHDPADRDDDGRSADGEPLIDMDQADDIRRRLKATKTALASFLKWAQLDAIEEMRVPAYKRAIEYLAAKARLQKAADAKAEADGR
jgi:ERF superfamily